ncbi:MAG: DNA polymerase III subunit beta, partial [Acidiferrobacterales bacterium]
MNLTIARDELLKPLGYVTGVVERRQTLPVLSNVLIRSDGE